MLGKVIFTILLAVAAHHMMKVLMKMDFHRTVPYHHAPGPCRQILKENGSEDLTVIGNGLAIISSCLYEKVGKMKLIDLSDPNAKVEDLIIEGGDGIKEFMVKPHGLSTWIDDKTGSITVGLITHPDSLGGDRVEMFDFIPSKRVLKHLYSITDPALYNLNDLVLVDKNSFYTTKTHGWRKGWRTLEMLLLLERGEILYYDGKTVCTIYSGLLFPNGINVSPTKEFLYMAEFLSSTIHVFRRNRDASLCLEQKIYLDSHPDNIEVDKQTGDLWVASSYILHDIADVLEAYESNKTKAEVMIAPSQVFKLKTENGLITDTIEVYLNNGTEITGSSIAAVFGNKMIIGSIASQTLVCDLVYVG